VLLLSGCCDLHGDIAVAAKRDTLDEYIK